MVYHVHGDIGLVGEIVPMEKMNSGKDLAWKNAQGKWQEKTRGNFWVKIVLVKMIFAPLSAWGTDNPCKRG